MAVPDGEGRQGRASLNPVTLQDIFTRMGHVEQQVAGLAQQVADLTTEVKVGLNGGKVGLRDRVASLEGRWNRLVGGGFLLVVLVSGWELIRAFL